MTGIQNCVTNAIFIRDDYRLKLVDAVLYIKITQINIAIDAPEALCFVYTN